MKRSRWSALLPALVLLVGLEARAAAPALEVTVPAGTKAFTLAELKKLRPTAGFAGTLNTAGRIVKPTRYQGVALADVIAAAGGAGATGDVVVTAQDGYRITYTQAQLAGSGFHAFDPASGDTLATHEPLFLLLAWAHEGKPLAAAEDGPLRVVVACAKGGALADAHLSVKNVAKVAITAAAAGPWTLRLTGARTEAMDQATFESGAAPGCHGVTWKDAQGHAWTGIPLWLLVGWVDDARKHGTGAFADDLAAGYTVELTGAGGARASFPGTRLARHDDILLAHRLDGAPLAGAAFPLRLAGAGLQPGEDLGGIVELTIRPAAAGAGDGPAK